MYMGRECMPVCFQVHCLHDGKSANLQELRPGLNSYLPRLCALYQSVNCSMFLGNSLFFAVR